MSDLTYSLRQLGELGSGLSGLAGQLEGASARVDADAAEVGHPDVVDALERQVEEQRGVLWFLPDDGVLVVLSLYVLDLVEGGRAAGPLHELAAGVRLSTAPAGRSEDAPR